MNDDSIFQKVSLPSCPHSTEKEYIYLIINNMNTYKVLIQKFINHRILSFFITVYSIL